MNLQYMDYEDSSLDFYGPQEDYHEYPKKKSTNSTEFSFKNMTFHDDSIDQYLVLDRNTTNEPRPAHNPRPKPLTNQEAIRLRNKINAKKSRQRKKSQFQKASFRLKELQIQNYRMGSQRGYCSRCQTKLPQPVSTVTEQLKEDRKIEIEFEKPQFKPQKTGRMWIAIGIVLLILGVNIHGVNKQEPLQVSLKNSAIISFKDQLKSNQTSLKLPLSFGSDMEQKKPKESILDISLTGLRIKSIDDKPEKPVQEQYFEINRDFISQLEGEINDIGRYI